MANFNYEAESNGIDNLMAELTNATYAPHIATLNMDDFVADIQETNDDFKQKFSKRSTDISTKEIFDMKLIRKATFENYNNYIQYVLSLAKVDTGTDYHKNILKASTKTVSTILICLPDAMAETTICPLAKRQLKN